MHLDVQSVGNTLTACKFLVCVVSVCSQPVSCNATALRSSLLSPAVGGSEQSLYGCNELDVLTSLGWQKAYHKGGYALNTRLPPNCSLATWQSLSCLSTVVNLTLTGSLPQLPDQWGLNGSFSSLYFLVVTDAHLTGSLPASWSNPAAFPQLQGLNFSSTQLSGSLPTEWAKADAFHNLAQLHIDAAKITGDM